MKLGFLICIATCLICIICEEAVAIEKSEKEGQNIVSLKSLSKADASAYFSSTREYNRNRVTHLYNKELPIVLGYDYYKVKECKDLEKKGDDILFLRSFSPAELKRAVLYYRKAVDNSDYYFGGCQRSIRQKLVYALVLDGRKSEAKKEQKKLSRKFSPGVFYCFDEPNRNETSVKQKQR